MPGPTPTLPPFYSLPPGPRCSSNRIRSPAGLYSESSVLSVSDKLLGWDLGLLASPDPTPRGTPHQMQPAVRNQARAEPPTWSFVHVLNIHNDPATFPHLRPRVVADTQRKSRIQLMFPNATSRFRLFPHKIIGVPFCLPCGVILAVAHGWALGLGSTHHHVWPQDSKIWRHPFARWILPQWRPTWCWCRWPGCLPRSCASVSRV